MRTRLTDRFVRSVARNYLRSFMGDEVIGFDITRWAYERAAQLTEQLADAEPSLDTMELLREMIRFRQLAVEWAHMAAPFVHPRLAAVAHRYTNPDGSPVGPRVNVIIHGAAPETPRFAETVPSISDKRH